MLPPQTTQFLWFSMLIKFGSLVFLYFVVVFKIHIERGYHVSNHDFQMETFSPKLIKYDSFTYELMSSPDIGINKLPFGSHQNKQNTVMNDLRQPKYCCQTILCYAVPDPLNTSENAVNTDRSITLGNTQLNTSTYTISLGIQEQTAHFTSMNGNNSNDIAINGTNEGEAQTSVTYNSELNNPERLPTNEIQEDTSQNIGTGSAHLNASIDTIPNETPGEVAQISADTRLETRPDSANNRSQAEPDQTLADQLRLRTLNGDLWTIYRCDRSLHATSLEEKGKLFVSSSKSQQTSCKIEGGYSNGNSKRLSHSLLNNVLKDKEPFVSRKNDAREPTDRKLEVQDQLQNIKGTTNHKNQKIKRSKRAKTFQEIVMRSIRPTISKQELHFNDKGMKNEVDDTKRGMPKENSTHSKEGDQENIVISRTPSSSTAQHPASSPTNHEQSASAMKGADNSNNQDDKSNESVNEDS